MYLHKNVRVFCAFQLSRTLFVSSCFSFQLVVLFPCKNFIIVCHSKHTLWLTANKPKVYVYMSHSFYSSLTQQDLSCTLNKFLLPRRSKLEACCPSIWSHLTLCCTVGILFFDYKLLPNCYRKFANIRQYLYIYVWNIYEFFFKYNSHLVIMSN